MKQLHAELVALGYDGSYNCVAAFARDRTQKRQEARQTTGRGTFVPQTHEMLFDAHNHAFRVFSVVPMHGIYDNMRTAVDKVLTGKARDVNARFAAMVPSGVQDDLAGRIRCMSGSPC